MARKRRERGTHGREVEGVADPEADPVGPRHDGGEQQLGDVQLEEEGEEGIGVDVERVGPVFGGGRWWRASAGRGFDSVHSIFIAQTPYFLARRRKGVTAWQFVHEENGGTGTHHSTF